MNFTSDNTHIIAEPILNAILKSNKSSVTSYGGDEITKKAITNSARSVWC